MKKLLSALGLTLVFGFAQAQSSVTVYGILDVGYIGTNYNGVGTSATTKQQTSAFGNSAESSSRLGFKGVEDLGSGTSAFFTIETGLNPNAETLSSFNNRQSFVGLKQNGVGQVAFGTQYTTVFNAVGATDAGQINNMIGGVIWATTPQRNGNPGQGPFAQTTSSAGTTDAMTVRTSNTLSASSESWNGLVANGFYALNNTNTTQTSATDGGNTNYNGYGLGANYTWQKLFLTANYQSLKSVVPGTLTSPVPSAWVNAGGGTNTKDNQTYLGSTYDFGILKAYAGWINRKVTDTINPNYYASRTAQQVGVRGYFTPRIDGWASVGNGRVRTYGSNEPTANFVGYQLGSNYYLSKRTNFYAIYGQNNTSSTSTLPAVGSSGYAVGIRHTF